jgi:hypothetical protein
MCFWCETHFVKDGLCKFVDVTICHIPEVRDQSWTAATQLIMEDHQKREADHPPSRKHVVVGSPNAVKFAHISQQAR